MPYKLMGLLDMLHKEPPSYGFWIFSSETIVEGLYGPADHSPLKFTGLLCLLNHELPGKADLLYYEITWPFWQATETTRGSPLQSQADSSSIHCFKLSSTVVSCHEPELAVKASASAHTSLEKGQWKSRWLMISLPALHTLHLASTCQAFFLIRTSQVSTYWHMLTMNRGVFNGALIFHINFHHYSYLAHLKKTLLYIISALHACLNYCFSTRLRCPIHFST